MLLLACDYRGFQISTPKIQWRFVSERGIHLFPFPSTLSFLSLNSNSTQLYYIIVRLRATIDSSQLNPCTALVKNWNAHLQLLDFLSLKLRRFI